LEFQLPSAKLDPPFVGTTSGGGDLLMAAELSVSGSNMFSSNFLPSARACAYA
jgi:hypothetical protein